jgi:hypothetical protein
MEPDMNLHVATVGTETDHHAFDGLPSSIETSGR